MARRTARSSDRARKASALLMVVLMAAATAFVFSGGDQQKVARTEVIGSDRIVSFEAFRQWMRQCVHGFPPVRR